MANYKLLKQVQSPQLSEIYKNSKFNVGDTVKVGLIVSDSKGTERVQYVQGILIKFSGSGTDKTFTLRKIGANGVGVELIVPINSKSLVSLEVVAKGKARRAKLYYLRNRVGKAATTV